MMPVEADDKRSARCGGNWRAEDGRYVRGNACAMASIAQFSRAVLPAPVLNDGDPQSLGLSRQRRHRERSGRHNAGCRCMGRAGGPVLRLRAEFPRPTAAVDPRQADPGLASRHRRPARPHRRTLFRLLLLLHRHPGRLVRRPDQPRAPCCRSPARSGARRRWPAASPPTIRSSSSRG